MPSIAIKELCTRAMREINACAIREVPKAEDIFRVLERFNDFTDELKTDQVMSQHVQRQLYTLTAGQPSYLIGPGGDFDTLALYGTQRPEYIDGAGFVNTAVDPVNPLETEVRVFTVEEWKNVVLKTQNTSIIWGIWYENDFTTTNNATGGTPTDGCGRIWTRPVISNTGVLALYVPVALGEVTNDSTGLATQLFLPPGYRNMYVYNLALNICDLFEKQPTQTLVANAARSMNHVKRRNSQPMVLKLPTQLARKQRRGYNILTNG